ncbi:hypothetical protein G3T14_20230 [Methylobacterium sp. BTF04]|uniref:hypothetical protein n=1 Tax=Methylobacterium sp. BTF04 TaxID=2708300 RepID=UPI0013D6590B|nr:hypothetical protein [Methylobacterium sp. BTF04]NEU14434.1 hypothetical protein [Methylobacterium sp. BTF04]
MSTWTASAFGLWAAYWAAMFAQIAQIAHLRAIDDGVGAMGCSWISRSLLAVGFAFFLLAKGL